nr:MAG TPA: hypothetical protein [Caudoviricetes sp.]DAU37778.1 MAG TPA: hypothetical protein [Caudoviricetes sp.]
MAISQPGFAPFPGWLLLCLERVGYMGKLQERFLCPTCFRI